MDSFSFYLEMVSKDTLTQKIFLILKVLNNGKTYLLVPELFCGVYIK